MTPVLDIIIGLFFVYLLLSLFSTALSELIAWHLDLRAKKLQEGLELLLRGSVTQGEGMNDALKKFQEHPLIKSLATTGAGPSYLRSETFATALISLVVNHKSPDGSEPAPATLELLKKRIGELPDGDLKKSLSAVVDQSVTDLAQARAAIVQWFDSSMERVSGWYKRHIQKVILGIGIGLALLLNADTITMAQRLSRDSAMRATILDAARTTLQRRKEATKPILKAEGSKKDANKLDVQTAATSGTTTPHPDGGMAAPSTSAVTDPSTQKAEGSKKDANKLDVQTAATSGTTTPHSDGSTVAPDTSAAADPAAPVVDVAAIQNVLDSVDLPLGWNVDTLHQTFLEWPDAWPRRGLKVGGWLLMLISKLLGLFLTVLALSLGAPFWFDLLNRIVSIRSAGEPPADKKTPASG